MNQRGHPAPAAAWLSCSPSLMSLPAATSSSTASCLPAFGSKWASCSGFVDREEQTSNPPPREKRVWSSLVNEGQTHTGGEDEGGRRGSDINSDKDHQRWCMDDRTSHILILASCRAKKTEIRLMLIFFFINIYLYFSKFNISVN